MRSHPRITIDRAQLQDTDLSLTDEQQHYLQRVLRLRPGDCFIAQDGQGQQWRAVISTGPAACLLETVSGKTAPLPLTLAAALPKSGFEEVVRQATEIGATQIQPLFSQRSLLRPSPQKLARWQRIAQEAAEQSERIFVPAILSPLPFTDWVNREATEEINYLCGARQPSPLLIAHLQQVVSTSPGLPITIAVGPEGGWTTEEIAVAAVKNYQIVSLGSAILRATTAALVALAIITTVREQLIYRVCPDGQTPQA
jgi:16S rRNA (uracil1498-N3)-methyltransferase